MKKKPFKAEFQNCPKAKICHGNNDIAKQGFIVGLLSLAWLFIRTGKKPSRISYPCQQTAMANVTLFLVPAFALGAMRLLQWLRCRLSRGQLKRLGAVALVTFCVMLGSYTVWHTYAKVKLASYYQNLRTHGPIGKKSSATLAAAAGSFLTLPHAMALPSAHRVVSVHDTDATHWSFSCGSSGSCAQYYGDDNFVDQAVVDQMVGTGLLALTGENNLTDAWRAILPQYQSGEIVAVKLNFNNSSAYDDVDAVLDALPQIVNSIVSGLTSIGVRQESIWVFDVSRIIHDRFRARIDFPGIRYIDRTGNGSDVDRATFNSPDSSAQITWNTTAYNGAHQMADLLVDADYLINVPLMKTHGGTGITLSLKNHLGSIDGFYTGSHSMHDYIYLTRGDYESSANAIVDINLNSNLADKTVLIIGDALYGGLTNNYSAPERWRTFGNDSPNMLFFGADPVAVDSVMYDYLSRETGIDPRAEDILIVAATEGLGVHERWNNNSERQYATIDYIEIEGADQVANDSPGSIGDGSGSGGGSGGCFIKSALP